MNAQTPNLIAGPESKEANRTPEGRAGFAAATLVMIIAVLLSKMEQHLTASPILGLAWDSLALLGVLALIGFSVLLHVTFDVYVQRTEKKRYLATMTGISVLLTLMAGYYFVTDSKQGAAIAFVAGALVTHLAWLVIRSGSWSSAWADLRDRRLIIVNFVSLAILVVLLPHMHLADTLRGLAFASMCLVHALSTDQGIRKIVGGWRDADGVQGTPRDDASPSAGTSASLRVVGRDAPPPLLLSDEDRSG